MPEVNRANIQLWIEALESGHYQQGTGVLRRGDQYCCLGVACDLAVRAGVAQAFEPAPHEQKWRYGAPGEGIGEAASIHLPPVVRDWLGLEDSSPLVVTSAAWEDGDMLILERNFLTTLNDHGSTFPYIAALIRATYLQEEQ